MRMSGPANCDCSYHSRGGNESSVEVDDVPRKVCRDDAGAEFFHKLVQATNVPVSVRQGAPGRSHSLRHSRRKVAPVMRNADQQRRISGDEVEDLAHAAGITERQAG